MKCLKEPLSRLANREEQTRGALFEGRFKSVAIFDEGINGSRRAAGAWDNGEKDRDEKSLTGLVPTEQTHYDRAHAIKKRPPSGDGRKTGAFLS